MDEIETEEAVGGFDELFPEDDIVENMSIGSPKFDTGSPDRDAAIMSMASGMRAKDVHTANNTGGTAEIVKLIEDRMAMSASNARDRVLVNDDVSIEAKEAVALSADVIEEVPSDPDIVIPRAAATNFVNTIFSMDANDPLRPREDMSPVYHAMQISDILEERVTTATTIKATIQAARKEVDHDRNAASEGILGPVVGGAVDWTRSGVELLEEAVIPGLHSVVHGGAPTAMLGTKIDQHIEWLHSLSPEAAKEQIIDDLGSLPTGVMRDDYLRRMESWDINSAGYENSMQLLGGALYALPFASKGVRLLTAPGFSAKAAYKAASKAGANNIKRAGAIAKDLKGPGSWRDKAIARHKELYKNLKDQAGAAELGAKRAAAEAKDVEQSALLAVHTDAIKTAGIEAVEKDLAKAPAPNMVSTEALVVNEDVVWDAADSVWTTAPRKGKKISVKAVARHMSLQANGSPVAWKDFYDDAKKAVTVWKGSKGVPGQVKMSNHTIWTPERVAVDAAEQADHAVRMKLAMHIEEATGGRVRALSVVDIDEGSLRKYVSALPKDMTPDEVASRVSKLIEADDANESLSKRMAQAYKASLDAHPDYQELARIAGDKSMLSDFYVQALADERSYFKLRFGTVDRSVDAGIMAKLRFSVSRSRFGKRPVAHRFIENLEEAHRIISDPHYAEGTNLLEAMGPKQYQALLKQEMESRALTHTDAAVVDVSWSKKDLSLRAVIGDSRGDAFLTRDAAENHITTHNLSGMSEIQPAAGHGGYHVVLNVPVSADSEAMSKALREMSEDIGWAHANNPVKVFGYADWSMSQGMKDVALKRVRGTAATQEAMTRVVDSLNTIFKDSPDLFAVTKHMSHLQTSPNTFGDFAKLWEDAVGAGAKPTNKDYGNYLKFRQVNDLAYSMDNALVLSEKERLGIKSYKLKTGEHAPFEGAHVSHKIDEDSVILDLRGSEPRLVIRKDIAAMDARDTFLSVERDTLEALGGSRSADYVLLNEVKDVASVSAPKGLPYKAGGILNYANTTTDGKPMRFIRMANMRGDRYLGEATIGTVHADMADEVLKVLKDFHRRGADIMTEHGSRKAGKQAIKELGNELLEHRFGGLFKRHPAAATLEAREAANKETMRAVETFLRKAGDTPLSHTASGHRLEDVINWNKTKFQRTAPSEVDRVFFTTRQLERNATMNHIAADGQAGFADVKNPLDTIAGALNQASSAMFDAEYRAKAIDTFWAQYKDVFKIDDERKLFGGSHIEALESLKLKASVGNSQEALAGEQARQIILDQLKGVSQEDNPLTKFVKDRIFQGYGDRPLVKGIVETITDPAKIRYANFLYTMGISPVQTVKQLQGIASTIAFSRSNPLDLAKDGARFAQTLWFHTMVKNLGETEARIILRDATYLSENAKMEIASIYDGLKTNGPHLIKKTNIDIADTMLKDGVTSRDAGAKLADKAKSVADASTAPYQVGESGNAYFAYVHAHQQWYREAEVATKVRPTKPDYDAILRIHEDLTQRMTPASKNKLQKGAWGPITQFFTWRNHLQNQMFDKKIALGTRARAIGVFSSLYGVPAGLAVATSLPIDVIGDHMDPLETMGDADDGFIATLIERGVAGMLGTDTWALGPGGDPYTERLLNFYFEDTQDAMVDLIGVTGATVSGLTGLLGVMSREIGQGGTPLGWVDIGNTLNTGASQATRAAALMAYGKYYTKGGHSVGDENFGWGDFSKMMFAGMKPDQVKAILTGQAMERYYRNNHKAVIGDLRKYLTNAIDAEHRGDTAASKRWWGVFHMLTNKEQSMITPLDTQRVVKQVFKQFGKDKIIEISNRIAKYRGENE